MILQPFIALEEDNDELGSWLIGRIVIESIMVESIAPASTISKEISRTNPAGAQLLKDLMARYLSWEFPIIFITYEERGGGFLRNTIFARSSMSPCGSSDFPGTTRYNSRQLGCPVIWLIMYGLHHLLSSRKPPRPNSQLTKT